MCLLGACWERGNHHGQRQLPLRIATGGGGRFAAGCGRRDGRRRTRKRRHHGHASPPGSSRWRVFRAVHRAALQQQCPGRGERRGRAGGGFAHHPGHRPHAHRVHPKGHGQAHHHVGEHPLPLRPRPRQPSLRAGDHHRPRVHPRQDGRRAAQGAHLPRLDWQNQVQHGGRTCARGRHGRERRAGQGGTLHRRGASGVGRDGGDSAHGAEHHAARADDAAARQPRDSDRVLRTRPHRGRRGGVSTQGALGVHRRHDARRAVVAWRRPCGRVAGHAGEAQNAGLRPHPSRPRPGLPQPRSH